MKTNHNFYSNLAFNLAEKNLGKTNYNPSVGCVVVKNNTVISSGVTSLNGRPHAEFNALNKKINFKGASIYVTLEPCVHYGVTPPCINIIKRKKIKNVFFSVNDPDLRTHKKAKKLLKINNIKCKQIRLNKKFYKSYIYNKKKGLPLIDAKIAISKDFFTINKKSKRITNGRSEKITHLLRSKYDSIISTSKSINEDNSLLNCRLEGLSTNQPDLIVIDRELKLKRNLKLLKITKHRKTLIFTKSNDKKKFSFFKKKGCKIVKIQNLDDKKDFLNFLKILYKIGKRRILIESGLTFLSKLLKFDLINELFLFRSSIYLKKNGVNNISSSFLKSFSLKKKINVNLDKDELYNIKVKNV